MATTPYLDLAGFKGLSLLPEAKIDRVHAENPSFFAATLVERSAHINSRLAKRYAAPFAAPYPEVVLGWLTRLVDRRSLKKAGYDPEDLSAKEIIADEETALAEIKEAADSEKGLFDLPLRADTTASGISKGAPLGYSESSPYVGFDRQRSTGREEDRQGTGTGDGS